MKVCARSDGWQSGAGGACEGRACFSPSRVSFVSYSNGSLNDELRAKQHAASAHRSRETRSALLRRQEAAPRCNDTRLFVARSRRASPSC